MARENKSNEVGLYVDWVPLVCVGQLGTCACPPCNPALPLAYISALTNVYRHVFNHTLFNTFKDTKYVWGNVNSLVVFS